MGFCFGFVGSVAGLTCVFKLIEARSKMAKEVSHRVWFGRLDMYD